MFEATLLTLFFFMLSGGALICAYVTPCHSALCLPLMHAALLGGIYVIAVSGLGALVMSSTVLWEYIALVALCLVPAGICRFFAETFPGEAAACRLSWCERAHKILAAAGAIGVAANIFSGAVMLNAFMGLSAATLFLCSLTLIRSVRSNSRQGELLLLTLLPVLAINAALPFFPAHGLAVPVKHSPGWSLLFLLGACTVTLKSGPRPPANVTAKLAAAARPLSLVNARPAICDTNRVAALLHEVNTPIGSGILTVSHLQSQVDELRELFRNGELKRSDLDKYLTVYKEASEILATNLENAAEIIRNFKRETAGEAAAAQTINLGDYLRKTVKALQPRVTQVGHRISLSVPDNLPVSVDTGPLTQVISNLVVNSLTHAFPPGVSGSLSLEASVENNMLTIIYRDDGQGIPPSLVDRMFEPQVTSNAAGGNSGLGLFVVRSLVTERLGGTLEYTGTPGAGASFVIRIPAERK